ncbi:MAG: DUF503 domain-containing protein [Planctomycetes bacterium]|nr:DUF503 domain-containing protein [Planctomycetota bacterium]
MLVGILKLSLFAGEARSLKDKRRIVAALKDRVRNRFNVSVAEVDFQDLHQRCMLAVAAVSNDGRYLNGQLDAVLDFVTKDHRIVLLSHEIEVF